MKKTDLLILSQKIENCQIIYLCWLKKFEYYQNKTNFFSNLILKGK